MAGGMYGDHGGADVSLEKSGEGGSVGGACFPVCQLDEKTIWTNETERG